MSNPGSRSNDDKLLAKIKDLEAKVEDLKRHTHPDASRGKPSGAAVPLLCAYNDGPTTVPTAPNVTVPWDHVAVNTLGATFNGTTTFTLADAGIYEFTVQGIWTDNPTGEAFLGVQIDGPTVSWYPTDCQPHFDAGTNSTGLQVAFTGPCEAGSEVFVWLDNDGDAGEQFGTFPTSGQGLVFTIKRLANWNV